MTYNARLRHRITPETIQAKSLEFYHIAIATDAPDNWHSLRHRRSRVYPEHN
jgi:hypothetical protein